MCLREVDVTMDVKSHVPKVVAPVVLVIVVQDALLVKRIIIRAMGTLLNQARNHNLLTISILSGY